MKKTKLFAFALALTFVSSGFTACGGITKEDGATLEIPFENSYRTTRLEKAWNWLLMDTIGDNAFFVKKPTPTQANTVRLMVQNTVTGETTEFEPAVNNERQKATNYTRAYMFLDKGEGKTGIVCTEFEYNMNNSEEKVVRRCIEVYDANWNLVEVEEIPEGFALDQTLGMQWSRRCTLTDAQGNWYHCDLSQPVIHTYNSDYQKYGEIRLTNQGESIWSFVNGADGAVYVCTTFWDDMTNEQLTHFYRLDAENRTAEEMHLNDIPDKQELTNLSLVDGSGDHLFYYITPERMYGVTAQGDVQEIIHWNNSDFVRRSIVECEPLPDGKFLLGETTSNASMIEGDTFYVAEQRTAEETADTKFMTLAAVDLSYGLEEAVLDYNRQETGWRIMMVDYPDAETLKADMLGGIVADIICTENLHFENLASKGLFADWYTLMDADEDFRREDYLPNFFEALEYDGKLLRLTYDYTVETYFAKTEFAPQKENYTAADYMDLLESAPDNMAAVPFIGRNNVVDWHLYEMLDMFINWQTGECAFDSPEFVRALQWAESLPENRKAEDMEFFQSVDKLFLSDQALLRQSTIRQPIRWHIIRRAYFRDAQITAVGMPMYAGQEGNNGTFLISDSVSVNAQSQYKDAAWNFMKYLLSEDYQKGLTDSMPIHIGVLDEKLTLATKMSATAEQYRDMTIVNVGAASEESMAELRAYICNIGRVSLWNGTDAQERIGTILSEEIERYFAGGCTAEECADAIQSRVSIYLSEQS